MEKMAMIRKSWVSAIVSIASALVAVGVAVPELLTDKDTLAGIIGALLSIGAATGWFTWLIPNSTGPSVRQAFEKSRHGNEPVMVERRRGQRQSGRVSGASVLVLFFVAWCVASFLLMSGCGTLQTFGGASGGVVIDTPQKRLGAAYALHGAVSDTVLTRAKAGAISLEEANEMEAALSQALGHLDAAKALQSEASTSEQALTYLQTAEITLRSIQRRMNQ